MGENPTALTYLKGFTPLGTPSGELVPLGTRSLGLRIRQPYLKFSLNHSDRNLSFKYDYKRHSDGEAKLRAAVAFPETKSHDTTQTAHRGVDRSHG